MNLAMFIYLKHLLQTKTWGLILISKKKKKTIPVDCPAGAVVKNPPANAGDTGSSPGLGRSHMPWSN